jgi:hypothetical protein
MCKIRRVGDGGERESKIMELSFFGLTQGRSYHSPSPQSLHLTGFTLLKKRKIEMKNRFKDWQQCLEV